MPVADAQTPKRPGGPNELAQTTSPYLIQHADNPVDWHPWGPGALALAAAQDKPILLSVGYSACHWCHVMAHESFENPRTAALMNEHFINIKVDREERPDIDAIYQKVVALMGQGGGWPLTVFLTPDQRPFYGGTYFPPDDRYGRPGFPRLLLALSRLWTEGRDEALAQAQSFMDGLADIASSLDGDTDGNEEHSPDLSLTEATSLREAGRRAVHRIDPAWGGFGQAPKFPNVPALELLRWAAHIEIQPETNPASETDPKPNPASALRHTLECMWRGGMYDHLRGGFARYSVDARWQIPHFEKMLYDNGLLLGLYADASVGPTLACEDFARRVVEESAAYLEADMRAPEGWFYSATDADSEGVEGKYFCWDPIQLEAALGAELALKFAAAHGVPTGDGPEARAGNFEHGMSALTRPEPISAALELELAPARATLLELRAQRVPPARDEKVLSAWNALVITGLCKAAAAALVWARAEPGPEPRQLAAPQQLADPRQLAARWTTLAIDAGEAIWRVHRDAEGRLLRASWQGQGHTRAYLEDVALLARAYLDLHELTLEPRWHLRAADLGAELLTHYARPGGGFFQTADDGEALIERTESQHDSPLPSGVAVAIEVLARLELAGVAPDPTPGPAAESKPESSRSLTLSGRAQLEASLHRFRAAAARPLANAGLIVAARWLDPSATHVSLHGPSPSAPGVSALASALTDHRARAFRGRALTWSFKPNPSEDTDTDTDAGAGEAWALVCRGQACSLPLRSPEALLEALTGA